MQPNKKAHRWKTLITYEFDYNCQVVYCKRKIDCFNHYCRFLQSLSIFRNNNVVCWNVSWTISLFLLNIVNIFANITCKKALWCRTVNIMDNMLRMMEKYANNLEELVDEKTHQYMEEKKKTDLLLYSMMPESVIPNLHDRANIEQTSSRHRANIKQAWRNLALWLKYRPRVSTHLQITTRPPS